MPVEPSSPLFPSTLRGKTIVITRPREQNSPEHSISSPGKRPVSSPSPPSSTDTFIATLEAEGATVLHLPLITVSPLPFTLPLLPPASPSYHWLFFTSGHGVHHFMAANPQPHLLHLPIGAVGKETAAALTHWGRSPQFVPTQWDGRHAAQEFGQYLKQQHPHPNVVQDVHVLWPCAQNPLPHFPEGLRQAGITVTPLPIYTTQPNTTEAEKLAQHLNQGRVDILIFTSPSGVRACHQVLSTLPESTTVVSIGPSTSATIQSCFQRSPLEPAERSLRGIAQLIQDGALSP